MDKGIHKYTCQEASNLQIGQAGFDVIASGSTAAITGNYIAIYNSSDSAATINATSAVGDNLSSLALWSGDMIYGNFTEIDCDTSHVIICYRG